MWGSLARWSVARSNAVFPWKTQVTFSQSQRIGHTNFSAKGVLPQTMVGVFVPHQGFHKHSTTMASTSSSKEVLESMRAWDKRQAKRFPRAILVDSDGIDIVHNPLYNKGTGHPHAERDRMGIRGLVPPCELSIEDQASRVMNRFDSSRDPLEQYLYLNSLLDRNETLFYRVLMENIKELAPIVYTPTVGVACQKWGSQFRRARGMYFTTHDRGEMSSMIWNWPAEKVDVVVVTDGSRILGLGDLGCHGMGIPIGKLMLYVAAGGIHPNRVLPVQLDVGTDNEELRNAPFYIGLREPRLRGQEYFDFVDEFMDAINQRYPNALIQFEDFQTPVALPLLEKFRERVTCFNDDIQGTGAVALAGLLGALKAQGLSSSDLASQRVLCVGAGSAGVGVCESILQGMTFQSLTEKQAQKQFWMWDHHGLLHAGRQDLTDCMRVFARDDYEQSPSSLKSLIEEVKPTILLGLSGQGGIFTEDIIRTMSKYVERPIIFPMSNPTSNAECTAEQAVHWSDGKAILASGSPFAPVEYKGKTHHITQGNNLFIFPGLGLGSVVSDARTVSDGMIFAASSRLAELVSEEELASGKVYPDISMVRAVSKEVAIAVAECAVKEGHARAKFPYSVRDSVANSMYQPQYAPLVESVHTR